MTNPTAANPKITTCDPVEGFTPQIGRYVAQLTEVRDDLKREVSGLSIAQLDWHPNDQTESIGTLLLHCEAIEWSWLHEDVLGRPSDEFTGDWSEALPIRVGAPQVTGRSVEHYLQKLDATRERTLQILRGFTDADLARLVGEAEPSPGEEPRSRLFTIDWVIWHIIEHEATHVGQVELLRRLAPTA
jgi:uncharacterized damage-inducible protein DinB